MHCLIDDEINLNRFGVKVKSIISIYIYISHLQHTLYLPSLNLKICDKISLFVRDKKTAQERQARKKTRKKQMNYLEQEKKVTSRK